MKIRSVLITVPKKDVNKYLVFDLLKKYDDVWNGIKNKFKEINRGKYDYGKDYIKIKFNSDDNLLLDKPLKFHMMAITIRSVFEEDGKLYRQVFLDVTLYELNG